MIMAAETDRGIARGSTMASVISLRSGTAEPVHHGVSGITPGGRFGGRLLRAIAAAIRRELAAREVRRLSDRHLRDIGLGRMDVADPSRVTVAWDAGTGTWLRPGASGP
jgi:uncharacterized protein YjiS (DUF1127 family)